MLLCIALVADGSGRALAATHAHGMAQATAHATRTSAACHDAAVPRTHAGHGPAADAAGAAAKHDDDCCRSDACRCACTHAGAGAPTAVPTAGVRFLRTPVPPRRPGAHPAPAPADPLRPPIA
nr:CopL family metal-binding regulatory protein [Coralloluteibacterium stylophorae]